MYNIKDNLKQSSFTLSYTIEQSTTPLQTESKSESIVTIVTSSTWGTPRETALLDCNTYTELFLDTHTHSPFRSNFSYPRKHKDLIFYFYIPI